jgi:cobalamin synthase
MDGSSTKTDLTAKQPGRGLFALAVTIGLAFTISAAVDLQTFNGIFTFITMSMVPPMAVIGLVWGGQYPPTQGLHQAWRGLALTLLTLTLGTIYCIAFLRYRGAWVVQPFVAIALITSIVTVFFLSLASAHGPGIKCLPLPRV